MVILEHFRSHSGYRLPRPTAWIIRAMSWFSRVHVASELFPGLTVPMNLEDDIQRCVYWQGDTFEAPTPSVLRAWCMTAEAFFDVGANFGFYSYYILASCPAIRVYSFEPNTTLFEQQRTTKALNSLARFFPYELALGDTETTLDLHLASADSGQSTFGIHPDSSRSTKSLRVSVTCFDDWINAVGLQLPQIPSWVMKMDVEGFEMNVLKGMKLALRAHAFKGLCIEINRFTLSLFGETSRAIYEYMESFGYQAFDDRMLNTKPQEDEFRNVFFLLPESFDL